VVFNKHHYFFMCDFIENYLLRIFFTWEKHLPYTCNELNSRIISIMLLYTTIQSYNFQHEVTKEGK